MARAATQGKRRRGGDVQHEGFLAYANRRYLKWATAISLVAILVYLLVDVTPRHNGGSWYGYLLGTAGAGLIVWLALLGIRKRAMTPGRWSLKAWTSAHVYLGLALIVIGTLHTGFQLGWNVHTLAYVMMMLVIASGIFGIVAYARLPQAMSLNRAETTQAQMLDTLRAIDRQIHDTAQPLGPAQAAIVRQSLENCDVAGGLYARITARHPRCGNRAALEGVRAEVRNNPPNKEVLSQLLFLLERKGAMLAQARRHIRYKTLLEIWLYVHVPATFALLAALIAHIVSVFFYW
ncbi:hypothetical protein ACFOMD_08035 [Sphingoaurantiacus capsulatus]|uniref:Ferric reductase like transmembrane component n=1 Tax=Sphingoaurantiacus capsulatus TaxID=1771310 RepID=A0ABV7XD22_9SPHN